MLLSFCGTHIDYFPFKQSRNRLESCKGDVDLNVVDKWCGIVVEGDIIKDDLGSHGELTAI
jgi:hypothetical protein